jgi:formylglycine-generating enzyme required for sulfatase activity
MGSPDSDPGAGSEMKPQHKVTLDAFWIDKKEVTNAM